MFFKITNLYSWFGISIGRKALPYGVSYRFESYPNYSGDCSYRETVNLLRYC